MEENNLQINKIIRLLSFFVVIGFVFSFYTGYILSQMKISVPFVSQESAALGNSTTSPKEDNLIQQTSPITLRGDEVFEGKSESNLVAVSFTDFECPFCARFHPNLKDIMKNNPEIKVVYKHFPLSFHQNAKDYASSFECVARLKGNSSAVKFADDLFAGALVNQGIRTSDVAKIVKDLGVSDSDLADCKKDSKITNKVEDDLNEGMKLGINGTPATYFMNLETNKAVRINGALDSVTIQAEIDKLK
jgi:protein-disulfide isomerase